MENDSFPTGPPSKTLPTATVTAGLAMPPEPPARPPSCDNHAIFDMFKASNPTAVMAIERNKLEIKGLTLPKPQHQSPVAEGVRVNAVPDSDDQAHDSAVEPPRKFPRIRALLALPDEADDFGVEDNFNPDDIEAYRNLDIESILQACESGNATAATSLQENPRELDQVSMVDQQTSPTVPQQHQPLASGGFCFNAVLSGDEQVPNVAVAPPQKLPPTQTVMTQQKQWKSDEMRPLARDIGQEPAVKEVKRFAAIEAALMQHSHAMHSTGLKDVDDDGKCSAPVKLDNARAKAEKRQNKWLQPLQRQVAPQRGRKTGKKRAKWLTAAGERFEDLLVQTTSSRSPASKAGNPVAKAKGQAPKWAVKEGTQEATLMKPLDEGVNIGKSFELRKLDSGRAAAEKREIGWRQALQRRLSPKSGRETGTKGGILLTATAPMTLEDLLTESVTN